jgi:uncharacterized lipoprotein NlpE involved in copper resistance
MRRLIVGLLLALCLPLVGCDDDGDLVPAVRIEALTLAARTSP